ncbi:MAG TPA: galactose-1-phosphate uridylyltransferase [Candidatus Sumerlaeota bacterium]|nr:galactose-1-phosphate uridylyltransferase [Candidatus Sumerlaeota bacterium]HOR28158.1 galactose-1-phosphate uridylyltransferase [Candidatus Sumerlaeota bacterium]HPK01729.1 galactose-1-phosphate uridylyltransferase [Candidatus Sumerlaeota bacterium]
MSELRQNLATREWVIIATERARRPHEFTDPARQLTHERPAHLAACPFCPGQEYETPAPVLRWPAEGPWRLRVFPNKYAALSVNGEKSYALEGVRRKLTGVGYHEVLVESPLHNMSPACQSPRALTQTLRAFQTRGRVLSEDPRIEQIFYFKNHGPGAGTSLEHPHCQLLALPMVPHHVRMRIESQRAYVDDNAVCPYCVMMQRELIDGERIVGRNRYFVALVPFAATSPFEIWIIPRRHGPTFLDLSLNELEHLAELMRLLFGKLYHGLGDPDYNYIIHSAPLRDSASRYLHWYMSIVPRVTKAAGFELGSGMYINPALPEESAEFLRNQDPGQPLEDEEDEPVDQLRQSS